MRCGTRRRFHARIPRRVRQPNASTSGVRPSASRRSCCKPLEIGEPDFDERSDRVLDPGFARRCEGLLVALARLRGVDSLLQPVIAGNEQLLNALARGIPLHKTSVTRQI